ncbi:MAG TPA: hypothetical protein VIJ00_11905 [Nakamurella sp.]
MSGRRGGRAAAAPIVDVYDVLLRSDKPMTVPQIAHALELRGKLSGYLSDALREYTATLPAAVQAEIPERPSADYGQEAWLWWVRRWVTYGRQVEWFQVMSRGRVSSGVRVREGEYAANRDKPPMVWRGAGPGTRPVLAGRAGRRGGQAQRRDAVRERRRGVAGGQTPPTPGHPWI